jgi:hypothetical protein
MTDPARVRSAEVVDVVGCPFTEFARRAPPMRREVVELAGFAAFPAIRLAREVRSAAVLSSGIARLQGAVCSAVYVWSR